MRKISGLVTAGPLKKTWAHLVGAFLAESGVVVPVDTGENNTLSARSSEWT